MRIFFSIFSIQFVFCAQNHPSLQTLINHFEDLKNGSNEQKIGYCSMYQNACKQVSSQLANDRIIPNHWIWYRAALAHVIYSLGFDIVKKNIDPLFPDWGSLKMIEEIDPEKQPYVDELKNSLQQWSFINWHSSLRGIVDRGTLKKSNVVARSAEPFFLASRDDTVQKVSSYDPQLFYCYEETPDGFTVLLKNRDDRELNLFSLKSATMGVICVGGPYYVILDYLNRSVWVYQCNNLGKHRMANLSTSVSWEQINAYHDSISVCIKGAYLILTLNRGKTEKKSCLYYRMTFDSDES